MKYFILIAVFFVEVKVVAQNESQKLEVQPEVFIPTKPYTQHLVKEAFEEFEKEQSKIPARIRQKASKSDQGQAR